MLKRQRFMQLIWFIYTNLGPMIIVDLDRESA